MPVNFLSEDQKAGFGNYHGELTKEALARYFHLNDFDRMNTSEKRGDHNRLGYSVLLCTVRYIGRFPDLTTIIPIAVIDFLEKQLNIESGSELVNIFNSGKQRGQHIDEIRFTWMPQFSSSRVRVIRFWIQTLRNFHHYSVGISICRALFIYSAGMCQ